MQKISQASGPKRSSSGVAMASEVMVMTLVTMLVSKVPICKIIFETLTLGFVKLLIFYETLGL